VSDLDHPDYEVAALPYRIAVLCYLYDRDGRLLLLHRRKEPNVDMYSPIGGKLEVTLGESPHECALREIEEEAELRLAPHEIRMTGMVSEKAYQGRHHWLIFLFEAMRPIGHDEIRRGDFDEGRLEWHEVAAVEKLPIPETDREFLWPTVRAHRGGFFVVHIDCRGERLVSTLDESWKAAGDGLARHAPPDAGRGSLRA
jgi:8-oxo-dGTP diphosphatase